MASIKNALLQSQSPLLLARRFRGKINIQRPRKPHFERQLLIDLVKPIYRATDKPLQDIDLCQKGINKWAKVEIDNPFERILARECLEWFNTSKMVIFLHLNSISMEDKAPLFANLKRNNMNLRSYGKKIVKMATTGTRYEVVNHLFTSHQNIIFGQPENAAKALKLLRKTPQLVVLAGIINDRLLSKNELVEFSKMPNLETARSQLCGILDSAGSCIVRQLQQSQETLVSHLNKHVELQTTPPSEENKE